jgi:hypothetical protein
LGFDARNNARRRSTIPVKPRVQAMRSEIECLCDENAADVKRGVVVADVTKFCESVSQLGDSG